MAPQRQVLVAFSLFLILLEVGAEDTSAKETKPAEKTEDSKPVAKRQYELGDPTAFHHSDFSLFNAGLLLAEYPFDYQFARELPFPQHFQGIYGFEGQRSVHQLQHDVATAPPRNPTKPVYHYTPLPRGTFPPVSPKEENERGHSDYLSNYGVNGGDQAKLQDYQHQSSYPVILPAQNLEAGKQWPHLTGFHPGIAYF